MTVTSNASSPKTDRRSETSALNGLKGGRPPQFQMKEVVIEKNWMEEAAKKKDFGLAMEKALARSFPGKEIHVSTPERIEKQVGQPQPWSLASFTFQLDGYVFNYPPDLRVIYEQFSIGSAPRRCVFRLKVMDGTVAK